MANVATPLTTIGGGINRLRTKGGADKNSLYDLLNGYVTQANTVKVRPGTIRNVDLSLTTGDGATKGLLAYESALHVFSAGVVPVPAGYALHVLNYPSPNTESGSIAIVPGAFAATTEIGTGSGYADVSSESWYAVNALINPSTGVDVGSASPTSFAGVNVEGFFQATSGSTHDANEVYLVTSGAAIPPGVTLKYPIAGGLLKSVALVSGIESAHLGLPTGYVVYALGTSAPVFDPNWYAGKVGMAVNPPTSATGVPTNTGTGGGVTTSGSVTATTSTKPSGANGSFLFSNGSIGVPSGVASSLNSGDWTIEFAIYPTSQSNGSGEAAVIGGSVSTTNVGIYWNVSTQTLTGQLFTAGIPAGGSNSVPENTWTDVAFVVRSGYLYLFLNGVQAGSAVNIAADRVTSPVPGILFGYDATHSGLYFNGNISGIRITNLALYSGTYTPPVEYPTGITLNFYGTSQYPIKEIHFAAPYLGGIYVVAEFDVSSALAAEFGTTFHYWVQSSTTGDNVNEWTANTDHQIGDIVIPTVPNGLEYVATRALPASPIWTANTLESLGNVVEPTIANGFNYTVTVVEGSNPSTGTTEPTWPTSDGATITENSVVANDQIVTLATAADAVITPTTPARYKTGLV